MKRYGCVNKFEYNKYSQLSETNDLVYTVGFSLTGPVSSLDLLSLLTLRFS